MCIIISALSDQLILKKILWLYDMLSQYTQLLPQGIFIVLSLERGKYPFPLAPFQIPLKWPDGAGLGCKLA